MVTGLPENKVRVIAPDVGGGFGSKIFLYAEQPLIALITKDLGVPVKWTETRSENYLSTTHGRDHTSYVEMALKRRHAAGLAYQDLRQPGRLSLDLRPADTNLPVWPAALGCLQTARARLRGAGGLHQYRAGGRLPRRRAPGSLLSGRAHDGPRGRRAGDRPGRDQATQLHPRRLVPPYRRHRLDVRQRKLRG